MKPADVLGAIGAEARRLSGGTRRSSGRPTASAATADVRRHLSALTDELIPVLERLADDDPVAAGRVRAALDALTVAVDPVE